MNLPSFEYLEPTSVQEACRLLKSARGAKILGGGTDLVPLMRMRLEHPTLVLALGAIPGLSSIAYDKRKGLTIGALTRLAALCDSPLVKRHCSMLAQAAEKIASPQMRNAATLGGNILLDTKCPYYNQSPLWLESGERCLKAGGARCLAVKGQDSCYAVWSSDTAPALVALDARVKLAGRGKTRWLPLDRLYTGLGDKPCKIAADEILTAVLVPEDACRLKSVYLRYSQRDVIDFPVVSVAAARYRRKNSSGFRLVAGGVDPAPKRMPQAEAMLDGVVIDEAVAERAAAAAAKEVGPIKDVFYPSRFKRDVLRALVEEAILACGVAGEMTGGDDG